MNLQKRSIPLSPFLEIGAERGQRSLLLVNEFGTSGFATDLSYESLLSAKSIKKNLGYKKMPILVCSDAYNLPFKNNSFPFIFCFQTLHHFPDPKPVIAEVYRVLAPGGYFYFGEEPVKQTFNLNLWRRDYNLTWWEKILKYVGILPFISTIGKSEVSEGVLEESFDLKTWRQAVSIFDKVEIEVKSYPFGPKILINVFGGGITALCKKETMPKYKPKKYKNILNLLKSKNPKSQEGVLMLLPKYLANKLYP